MDWSCLHNILADDAFSNIVQIFVALISAGVGLLIYLTLSEMQKQRRSSYKPELIIKDTFFYIDLNLDNPIYASWRNKEERESGLSIDDYDLLIELKNIGFGIAKNIKCEWEFDIKDMINKLNSLEGDLAVNFEINNERFNMGFQGEKVGFDGSMIKTKYDLNRTIQFIEHKGNENCANLILPYSLQKILEIYCYKTNKYVEKYKEFIPESSNPLSNKIYLTIIYTDILGDLISQKYQVKFLPDHMNYDILNYKCFEIQGRVVFIEIERNEYKVKNNER